MVGRRRRRFDPYSGRSAVVGAGAVSHLQLLRPFDLFPHHRRRRRRTEFQINDRHYCSPPAPPPAEARLSGGYLRGGE